MIVLAGAEDAPGFNAYGIAKSVGPIAPAAIAVPPEPQR